MRVICTLGRGERYCGRLGWGTLMSHGRLATAIALLALGMVAGTARSALVATRRAADAHASLRLGALAGAVHLAPIATPADRGDGRATGALKNAERLLGAHAPSPGEGWTNGVAGRKLGSSLSRGGEIPCCYTLGDSPPCSLRGRNIADVRQLRHPDWNAMHRDAGNGGGERGTLPQENAGYRGVSPGGVNHPERSGFRSSLTPSARRSCQRGKELLRNRQPCEAQCCDAMTRSVTPRLQKMNRSWTYCYFLRLSIVMYSFDPPT